MPENQPPPQPAPGEPPNALRRLGDRIQSAVDEFDLDRETVEQIASRPIERRTWQEVKYLLSSLPLGVLAIFFWTIGGPFAAPLALTIVGIPVVALMFWLFRKFAHFERRRVGMLNEPTIPAGYLPLTGNPVARAVTFLSDTQTWKDMAWMLLLTFLALPLAFAALCSWLVAAAWIIYPLWGWWVPSDFSPAGFIFGDFKLLVVAATVPIGMAMLVAAAWICAGVSSALLAISRMLLGPSTEQELQGRVSELERTREQSVSQQSSELNRIERDLHDGAQARLVALAIDLGMAEQKISDDPDSAKKLVADARDEAQRTLQELRELVRGLGPQILRDRGLSAALVPLAARSPIPVELNVALEQRPGEHSETVAYFIVSEALANAGKHSGASSVDVAIWRDGNELLVRVSDDGDGGATLEGTAEHPGGLLGLKARAEAVDGRFLVESPSGGPTMIEACLPFG